MPLTLVTGPANSEKAGAVLDPFRAAIRRGAILVVPTFGDVERLRRSFAEEEQVFGVRIEQFGGLLNEIAHRTQARPRPLGDHARRRVLAAAIGDCTLEELAEAAETAGFVGALERLADELRAQRVPSARFTQALTVWAAERDARRARYAAELAALYAAYRRRLEGLRREDPAGYHAAALDTLRREPARWGTDAVFVYGFDDLTAQQLDALDALGRATEVTVSLSFEAGRQAFAARTGVFHDLRAVADTVRELPPNAEHYAPQSRDALHHLERGLFEEGEHALFATVAAGGAIELLEGGGERAELELVAAAVASLLRDEAFAPEEIAVVLRTVDDVAPLVEQVFAAHGVPVAIDRRVPLGQVPIGRALLGFLRAALLDGDAADLLVWLRAPGVVRVTGALDELEREIRMTGARTAADARTLWEADRFTLHELDRVRDGARRGGRALCDAVANELMRLLALPHRASDDPARGTAPILTTDEAIDAAACRAVRRTLEEIARLAERHPGLAPSPAELVRELEEVQVRAATVAPPGAIAVTDPLTIRARRVRALFACRLQEGIFPRTVRPPALLDDEDRRELARASGLILPRRDDELASERHLFYAVASRPEERLVLSWHLADDEGQPAVRSFLVDEVVGLFGDEPQGRTVRRELGAVGWDGENDGREALRRAASLAPREREAPIAPLRDPRLLAGLAARETVSASALEVWAACPVRWFVQRALQADDLEATPEALARGQLAHAALEAVIQGLGAVTEDARLTTDKLPQLRRLVREALAEGARETPLSTDQARIGILARRLERDLLRYVEHAAAAGSPLVPTHTEVGFGDGSEGSSPPLVLAPGVAARGRIDRVDIAPDGRAVVWDYKGRAAKPYTKWVEEGRFQVAIYALAARELLGLEVVGGLYQPLVGADLRGRGALRDDPDLGVPVGRDDIIDADTFDAVLRDVVAEAVRIAGELRAGALRPQPATCGVGASTGCQYPTICRCEE
ncbi:MAG: PD-(D/E)XK nuclease family protein [Solirubrobacteraceae bacterium]